jgi:hypothetical protein
MVDIKSKKTQKANHKKQNGGDIQTGMREFIVKVLKKGCKFLRDRNYDNGTKLYIQITLPQNLNIVVTHEFQTHDECELNHLKITHKPLSTSSHVQSNKSEFNDDLKESIQLLKKKGFLKHIFKIVIGCFTENTHRVFNNVYRAFGLNVENLLMVLLSGMNGNEQIEKILQDLDVIFDRQFPKKTKPQIAWTEELPEPSKLNFGRIPSKAYDYIELEEIDVAEYIKKDPRNNIVMNLANTRDAVLYETKMLEKDLNDDNRILFPCGEQAHVLNDNVRPALGIDMRRAMLRLNLTNMNVNVPVADIKNAIDMTRDGEENIYAVVPTDLKFERTGTFDAAFSTRSGSWISADHCQAGTKISVYRLLPFKYSKNVNGGSHKKKISQKPKKVSLVKKK